MEKITEDNRLHATHVSLYISLFTLWNLNHFKNPITINREELMRISKIGSRHTYHKCLKNLHEYGYLKYTPSHNPLRGSQVHLFNFDTSNEQVANHTYDKSDTSDEQVPAQPGAKIGTSSEQALHPSINSINHTNNKQNKQGQKIPPNTEELKNYFEERIKISEIDISPEQETQKFYDHFSSNGWKVGGKAPMKDWKAAVRNWLVNAQKFAKQNPKLQAGHLSSNPNKNYDEPL